MRRILSFALLAILLGLPLGSHAEETLKPSLTTKILYNTSGKPKIEVNSHDQTPNDTATNKIQTALTFYSYALNQVPEANQSAVQNQAQLIVTEVATEAGIKRANILSGNPLIQNVPSGEGERGFELVFGTLGTKGNSLKVNPIGKTDGLLVPSIFYLFQETINTVPDNGLRLIALALGGTNKWYREIGKATDPNSVSQAPAYGLNLALDILSKLSGTKL